MATIQGTSQSYPTSYTTSGSIHGTKYTGAIGKGADTAAVSGNDYAGSSGSTAYVEYHFQFDIPETATIDSVECAVKGHLENTSKSTATLRLYSGSTAKGSESKFSSTSAQTITMTTGSWTRSEVDDMRLRFTIGYYGGLVNGATVTVNYSYDATTYTITTSATGVDINPSGSTDVLKGEDFLLWIDGAENIHVTDNNVDVTSELVEKEKVFSDTINAVPNNYSTSGYINGSTYTEAIGKGYDAASVSGNDYASDNATIDYFFDLSGIPENATIDSVIVRVKGHCESTTNSSEVANVQLYSGSIAKGESQDFTTTSDSVLTFNNITWTRAELQDAKIRFTIGYYGGAISGATFTVTYSVPVTGYTTYYEYALSNISEAHVIVVSVGSEPELFIRLNGVWTKVAVYKKTNGYWAPSDPETTFESGVNYVKGN